MHARLFDMLHDARDEDIVAVTDRIDIDFDRIDKILIDQQRRITGDSHRLSDIAFQIRVRCHDLHAASAKHV